MKHSVSILPFCKDSAQQDLTPEISFPLPATPVLGTRERGGWTGSEARCIGVQIRFSAYSVSFYRFIWTSECFALHSICSCAFGAEVNERKFRRSGRIKDLQNSETHWRSSTSVNVCQHLSTLRLLATDNYWLSPPWLLGGQAQIFARKCGDCQEINHMFSSWSSRKHYKILQDITRYYKI